MREYLSSNICIHKTHHVNSYHARGNSCAATWDQHLRSGSSGILICHQSRQLRPLHQHVQTAVPAVVAGAHAPPPLSRDGSCCCGSCCCCCPLASAPTCSVFLLLLLATPAAAALLLLVLLVGCLCMLSPMYVATLDPLLVTCMLHVCQGIPVELARLTIDPVNSKPSRSIMPQSRDEGYPSWRPGCIVHILLPKKPPQCPFLISNALGEEPP